MMALASPQNSVRSIQIINARSAVVIGRLPNRQKLMDSCLMTFGPNLVNANSKTVNICELVAAGKLSTFKAFMMTSVEERLINQIYYYTRLERANRTKITSFPVDLLNKRLKHQMRSLQVMHLVLERKPYLRKVFLRFNLHRLVIRRVQMITKA